LFLFLFVRFSVSFSRRENTSQIEACFQSVHSQFEPPLKQTRAGVRVAITV
jgi:hypothetical protein